MIIRNIILFIVCLTHFYNIQAQLVKDSISMGSNYTHQVFYSLDNGEISNIDNNDWDIAFASFQRGAAGSAILINEATTTLWSYPGDTSSWNKFDTTGYANWERLLNSDTSWTNGAFNKNRGVKGLFDMGWGELNPNNNFWTFGNTLYLAQLQNDQFIKIWIVSLKTGIWEFKYASMDGSNERSVIINKNDYPNKNFIYHSFISHQTLDREPNNSTWDFMFTKHVDEVIPNLYLPVTSVFNNRKIWSAKANKPSYDDAINATLPNTAYNQRINNIGREWKRFKRATGWTVYDSIAYFVYDYDSSNFYRIVFTEFEGLATGKAYFTKQLLQNVAVNSIDKNIIISTYPNPAVDQITLLMDYPEEDEIFIRILDLSGQTVFVDEIMLYNGINQHNIAINNLSSGYYILTISNDKFTSSKKIIIR